MVAVVISLLRVYPRVCGGTGQPVGQIGLVEGLSPRVRGNRHDKVCDHCGAGSIPACAGEPVTAYTATGLS